MSHISLHGVSALGKKKNFLFWYGLSAHRRTKLASAECFAGLSCIVTVDNVGLGSSISREGLSKRSFRMHKRSEYNLYSVHFTMQKKKEAGWLSNIIYIVESVHGLSTRQATGLSPAPVHQSGCRLTGESLSCGFFWTGVHKRWLFVQSARPHKEFRPL